MARPAIAVGQRWRLHTMDGPVAVPVTRVYSYALRGAKPPRDRRIELEQLAGNARFHPDDWREHDLTHSPNAELIATGAS